MTKALPVLLTAVVLGLGACGDAEESQTPVKAEARPKVEQSPTVCGLQSSKEPEPRTIGMKKPARAVPAGKDFTCQGKSIDVEMMGPNPAREGYGTLVMQYSPPGGNCIKELKINGKVESTEPCTEHELRAGVYQTIMRLGTFEFEREITIPKGTKTEYPYSITKCGPGFYYRGHTCP